MSTGNIPSIFSISAICSPISVTPFKNCLSRFGSAFFFSFKALGFFSPFITTATRSLS